ncbi:MAG: ATP-binding protein [Oscillospiraceae bacterium]|nr:ATP-binding protein [Oscillospiraceae bacterium]
MGMLSLSDIELYKHLSSRKTDNAKQYAGILILIAPDADYLLQHIKNYFPAYPDHGIQHSFRILQFLSKILKPKYKTFSDTELFCLIMAALFHDTAMALFTHKDIANIRSGHHKFASEVLEKYFDEHLTILPHRERLKPIIEFACYAHGLTLQELYSDSRFSKKDTIEYDDVRYSILSVLLRIGDLMDLEQTRTNDFSISIFRSIYSPEAMNHNIRHAKVQSYSYNPDEIAIEVLAENVEQYKIWSVWLDYLKGDILHANTYVQADLFPKPNIKINKPADANFDVEELRFEIDDKGGIWNILSQSIYTDQFDFIRELVQNAIDASLMSLYVDPDISLTSISPRSWPVGTYCSDVLVGYSENRNILLVIDSGIGMNKKDLSSFLFKVTGSGYSDSGSRTFEFPSIAKFGIGFVSCLINASAIEIFTRKQLETGSHQVSLATKSNIALIQDISEEGYQGTAIRLHSKYSFKYAAVVGYLKRTFVFPSVQITCVNLDAFEKISKRLVPLAEYDQALSLSSSFRSFFESIEKQRLAIDTPLSDRVHSLGGIAAELHNLIEWIRSNKYEDTDFSDKQKFKLFKEKLRFINALVKRESEYGGIAECSLQEDNVSQKDLFNSPEGYIDALNDYAKQIEKREKEYSGKRLSSYSVHESIGTHCVSSGFNWNYCVVYLDDELKICSIQYSVDPIDLSKETGIVFIAHDLADFNEGIEYSAVNAFLFTGGVVRIKLGKFKGMAYSSPETRTDETFIIGSMANDLDLLRDLEERYWDDYDDPEISADYHFNSDGEEEPGRVYSSYYDAIYVANNRFLFSQNIRLPETSDVEFLFQPSNLRNLRDETLEFDIFERATRSLVWQDTFPEKTGDIDRIMQGEPFQYCQDGICIPLDHLENLFPLGVFRFSCNCTAGSRMTLNVTRHKMSENQDDVDEWVKTTGYSIQSSLLEHMTSRVRKLSLKFVTEGPPPIESTDYFQQAVFEQFWKLLPRYSL